MPFSKPFISSTKKSNIAKPFSTSSRYAADPFLVGGVTYFVTTHIPFRNTIFISTIMGFLIVNLVPHMALGSSSETIHPLLFSVREVGNLLDSILSNISSTDMTVVPGETSVYLNQLLHLQDTVFPNLQSQINTALSETNLLDSFHRNLEEANDILEDLREEIRSTVEDLNTENMDRSD